MKKYYVDATVRLVVTTNGFDDPTLILEGADFSVTSDSAEIEAELTDFTYVDVK